VLSLCGVSKRYGARCALDALSVELPRGQFVALLGPNGAGKSTLFQLLTGLFAPDAGRIRVAGFDLATQARHALARIGVVFQPLSLDLDLSVRRNLRLHADLHGLAGAVARERIDDGCRRAGLSADLDRPARELSGGSRRKVELVRALLHRPSMLLMDEATVGLDPQSRRDLLTTLHAEAANGATVLWATHWVEEAQGADRVLVLHSGRLLADGTPAGVARQLGGASLEDAFVAATRMSSHAATPKETSR
jgi:ABC-2 type transport system ATP-binding protein